MNGFYKKFLGLFFFLALVVLFLPLQGCPDPVNDQLTEGSVFEVELQVLGDGSLYALEIESADADEDDDDEDENEQEGENEDGDDDDEDDDDEENEQEGEHEDGDDDDDENEDVDKGFSVQVDSVAADCSSFTVFGTLVVVLDDDDDDDDDDEDELGICDLSAGMWIEVEGFYGSDGFFYAEEIEEADEEETEMVGVIENLTSSTFTIFGVMITYDSNTEIDLDDDDDNDDDDNDDDDDDDECEQEGENEGDNEGC